MPGDVSVSSRQKVSGAEEKRVTLRAGISEQQQRSSRYVYLVWSSWARGRASGLAGNGHEEGGGQVMY